jgi:hypothetical protein
MTPTLAELIDEFVLVNPQYADGATAWGMCDAASWNFIAHAKRRGYTGPLDAYTFYATHADEIRYQHEGCKDQTNPDPKTYIVQDEFGCDLRNDNNVTMCHWHCIVDAGHILIDFTARQYGQHYAYPHIIAIEENLMTTRDKAMVAGVGTW